MTNSYEDVLMIVVKRPIRFTDYDPRNVPGFTSNIASVVNCSDNQTANLLAAVDTLEDDSHFLVEKVVVEEGGEGSKGKQYPKKLLVTVSAA